MNDWEEFELLAQHIQADLAPQAQVTRNEKLRGRSDVEHQCDVVVRSKVGQFDFTCIIECKDKRAKVNLETVRAFVARVEDLGVSQGVIVAAKGFTKDALRFAMANSILTYTLFDAKSVKWNKQALVPLVVGFVSLKQAGIEFTNAETGNVLHFESGNTDWRKIPLLDTASSKWITVKEYLEHKWDEYADARGTDPLERADRIDMTQRYELYANRRRYKVTMKYWLEPDFMWCYKRMPLIAGRGFVDQASGALLLGAEYDARIPLWEAHDHWPKVDRIEDVPFRPLDNLWIRVICFYHGTATTGTSGDGMPEILEFGRRRT